MLVYFQDPLAGIIPRALSQLFDELRISNTEHTVRVSYLELYNEELFDLLSSSEDNSKLRIYEDVTRKGSNIVNGLEEITVSVLLPGLHGLFLWRILGFCMKVVKKPLWCFMPVSKRNI